MTTTEAKRYELRIIPNGKDHGMRIGDKVTNQAHPRLEGVVIGDRIPGLDGWVLVEWENGETVEEWVGDLTERITDAQGL